MKKPKIVIRSVKDLGTIDTDIRKLISDHIEETGSTPTTFANEVGIHPAQMLSLVNKNGGMRFDTLVKIGKNAK
jgi:plasmid maintenance system antidote protein VapI